MCKKLIFPILCLIRVYQKCISPFLGNHCRFYPSCSQYAHDAFVTHTIFKAIYLTSWRILRCHPFNKGGIDPARACLRSRGSSENGDIRV